MAQICGYIRTISFRYTRSTDEAIFELQNLSDKEKKGQGGEFQDLQLS